MTALALMIGPTSDGWGVFFSDGRELARFHGLCAKRRALKLLRRYVG